MKNMEEKKTDVLIVLSRHIGKETAVGMGELYQQIFGRPWSNRINDTRDIRKLITSLRETGVPICSHPGKNGGGYYLAAAGSELEAYLNKRRRQALKILWTESKIREISMAELLGQMQLQMADNRLTDNRHSDEQTVCKSDSLNV